MDIDIPAVTNATCIERLQQALRVMDGLSDAQRANFDINVIARRTETGITACIAGYCGFDPWFQARGFSTIVGEGSSIGGVTVSFNVFFGTSRPFVTWYYCGERADRVITVDDAIEALRQEIDCFKRAPGEAAALTA